MTYRLPILHLADHKKPQSPEQNEGSQISDPVRPTLFGRILEPDFYPMLLESVERCGIVVWQNNGKAAAISAGTAN